MRLPLLLLGAAGLLLALAAPARGDGSDHRYKLHEEIPLAANKAGPFNNPRCVRTIQCALPHLLGPATDVPMCCSTATGKSECGCQTVLFLCCAEEVAASSVMLGILLRTKSQPACRCVKHLAHLRCTTCTAGTGGRLRVCAVGPRLTECGSLTGVGTAEERPAPSSSAR